MILVVTIFVLLFFPETFAHDVEKKTSEYRLLNKTKLLKGEAYLIAREDGHLLGQPYQIELRVNCSGDKTEVMDLEIKDSFSVCDMKPESIKINKKKTALAMKVKVADLESYYKEVEEGDTTPEVKCALKTSIKKFSLKNLCN